MTTINAIDYHKLTWNQLRAEAKRRNVIVMGKTRDRLIEALEGGEPTAQLSEIASQPPPKEFSLPESVWTMRPNTRDSVHIFSLAEQCVIACAYRQSPPVPGTGEKKMTSFESNAKTLAAAPGCHAALTAIAEALEAGRKVDPAVIRRYLANIEAQRLPMI